MAKIRTTAKQLGKKHSEARRRLAKSLKAVRRKDFGGGSLPYNKSRHLHDAPFKDQLKRALERRVSASRRQINVLDKGAGTGAMAAEIKAFQPDKIRVTALTLSKTLSERNKENIDVVRTVAGIRAKHPVKYDLIYDSYGEDYYLGKSFVMQSILRSISLLKKGGELFTVVPLIYTETEHALSSNEGKALVSQLRRRKNITVKVQKLQKRFEKIEYVDMVIHVVKK